MANNNKDFIGLFSSKKNTNPALKGIIEDIKNNTNPTKCYDRTHHRHNRGTYDENEVAAQIDAQLSNMSNKADFERLREIALKCGAQLDDENITTPR